MTAAEHNRIMTFAYITAMLLMMVGIFTVNAVIYYRNKKRQSAARKRIDEIIKNRK